MNLTILFPSFLLYLSGLAETPLRLALTIVGVSAAAVACRAYGTHRILKWPIFCLLMGMMAIDLLLYVAVRLMIALCSRRTDRALVDAADYSQWLAAAEEADKKEGRDEWRREPTSDEFDYRQVQATTWRLKTAREARDWTSLMALCQTSLKTNAFGELEFRLYCVARSGTKLILEDYRDELCRSLRALGEAELAPGSFVHAARAEFCLAARASFGGSALVLSGGALFGVYHLGVVKALLELGMLPPVICGASAGAVIASIVCTRHNDELKRILYSQDDLYRELGSHGPFVGSMLWKLTQLYQHGQMYKGADFHKHMAWFAQGLTFREAYEKTGRVLTISATPVRSRGRRASPIQLNHLSTPHVDIASAVCASSCVPGLIEPVELLEKGPDGKLRPYHMADLGSSASGGTAGTAGTGGTAGAGAGTGGGGGGEEERIVLRDGSFESDVPLGALAATFGATFTIVSQVNPHVVPFYAHLQGRAGRPSGGRDRTGAWRGGFLLGACEVSLKEDMRSHLRTLKALQLGRSLFGVDWSNLWLQPQFDDSSVVLTPEVTLRDYFTALDNVASPEELAQKVKNMERATWEAVSLIRMRMDVDRALDYCAAKCDVLQPNASPLVRVPSASSVLSSCSNAEQKHGEKRLQLGAGAGPGGEAGAGAGPSHAASQVIKKRARVSPARRASVGSELAQEAW